MELVLYSTDFCQLCDEALALVEKALEGYSYQLDIVDISEYDDLMAQYAYSIPVLKRRGTTSLELKWPFSEEEIWQLVAQ